MIDTSEILLYNNRNGIERGVFLMFKNVGRKIKILAKVFFWISIICSVLLAVGIAVGGSQFIAQFSGTNSGALRDTNISTVAYIITAVVVLIVGFLGAWLESLLDRKSVV